MNLFLLLIGVEVLTMLRMVNLLFKTSSSKLPWAEVQVRNGKLLMVSRNTINQEWYCMNYSKININSLKSIFTQPICIYSISS